MLRFLPVVIHLILLLNLIYPIRLLQVTWCHAAYDAELAKQGTAVAYHYCYGTCVWYSTMWDCKANKLCLFHLTVKHCFLPEGGF